MIHQTHLVTWVVRTAGNALAILIGIPVVGAIIAGVSDEPSWLAVGSVAGVVGMLLALTGAQAPFPTDEVIKLLDPEET